VEIAGHRIGESVGGEQADRCGPDLSEIEVRLDAHEDGALLQDVRADSRTDLNT